MIWRPSTQMLKRVATTSMCVVEPGETIDLEVKFDPSSIGRRRATLLISYRDTLNRTKEIPLQGVGTGARGGTARVG